MLAQQNQIFPFQQQRISRYSIGIDSRIVDIAYAPQKDTMLCWAANIQVSLAIKGLHVDQNVFASNLCGVDKYGRVNNCPATNSQMGVYMNGCSRDNYGRQYCIKASLNERKLTADDILNHIGRGNPIIAGYKEDPNYNIGHAVLLTGAIVSEDKYTGIKTIEQLIKRDPADHILNKIVKGRHEVHAGEFISKMYAWWVPQVSSLNRNRFFA